MSKHWEGYTVITNEIIKDKTLDTFEFRIFLLIESYSYRDKKNFSISYIEKVLGISRGKITLSLKKLVAKKYIKQIDVAVQKEHIPATYTSIKSFRMKLVDTETDKEPVHEVNRGCSSDEQGPFMRCTKEVTIKGINNKKKERELVEEIKPHFPILVMETISIWNSLSPLKLESIDLTPDIVSRICGYIYRKEKANIVIHDILEAIENYHKTINNPNSWYKSQYTLQSFMGINGRKEQLSKFLPQNFEPLEYVKSSIGSAKDDSLINDVMNKINMENN